MGEALASDKAFAQLAFADLNRTRDFDPMDSVPDRIARLGACLSLGPWQVPPIPERDRC